MPIYSPYIITNMTTASTAWTTLLPITWTSAGTNVITTNITYDTAATNYYWQTQLQARLQGLQAATAEQLAQQQAQLAAYYQQLQANQAQAAYGQNPYMAEWQAEQQQAQVTENVARREASGRAKRLLVAHLNPAQRDSFDKHGYFDILKGAYFYRVFLGRSANVIQFNHTTTLGPRPVVALCCHPASYVPDEDTVLAQKFMLEHDESSFLKLANRHSLESAYARHYLRQLDGAAA